MEKSDKNVQDIQGDKRSIGRQGRRPFSRLRKPACFTLFFIILFMLCGTGMAVLWAGGWLKNTACSLVLEDSYLWSNIGCGYRENVQGEGQEGQIIDMDIPDNLTSNEDIVTVIVEKASPAVVTVAVNSMTFDYDKGFLDEEDGIGSGFIIDPEGLIITNQHVVSDKNEEYSVILPGESEAVAVEEVYRDNVNDLAILKIDRTGLPALELGDSNKLKRGNLVIAIGNPFGDFEGTATVGYVTGLNRDVSAGSGWGTVAHYEGVIQTDAAINPGNSGGPLLNSEGKVIGVNFATTSGADNISFAIPISHVKDRLDVFEQQGRFPQPYIGISYSQRTVFLRSGALVGAVVFEVEKGGPSDRVGLQKGDIILEVSGKDLVEYDLASIIQASTVGDKLELEVWREGEVRKLEVVVEDRGE